MSDILAAAPSAPAPPEGEEFLRRAVAAANIPALRLALYQQTRDPELAAMPVEERLIRGGALRVYDIPEEHHATIRRKACEFLASSAQAKPAPSLEETAELIALFTGKIASPTELAYGYEELGFAEIPRNTTWSRPPPADVLNAFHVTIVGAGFSGIAAAIQLSRLGIPYRIVERHPAAGGTWFVNDYPEARVDIPSFLYQYKFERDYRWKSYFGAQAELREYAEYMIDKYAVRPHISFSTELTDARWDAEQGKWVLTLRDADGALKTQVSNVLISASGTFSTPKLPDIPGAEHFQGKMFHTTAWDHSFDYTGKRVALVGTGSTGTQLARGVAQTAAKLTIYQRTPNWITPIRGYHDPVSPEKQWMLDHMPGYRSWFIFSAYVSELQLQEFQELDLEWVAKGGRVNERNDRLASALTDYIRAKVGHREDLFSKLVPTYAPLARRLVIDNAWYDTLLRDNVELVASGVRAFTSDGVISDDGVERKADLVVLAAGFKVTEYLWPARYQGRDGTSLEDLWGRDGARAYKGMTLPGFPNFFMMYGPNGQTRGGGFHSWVEILSRYISGLVVEMIESGKRTIEVRGDAYDEYNARLDREMKTVLWENQKGGGGYYINEHGRSTINMPWTIDEYYQLVSAPDPENFAFT
ncbi:MAG: NAD(P)/FAD-dependent oxidoreductase [Caulobacterales bacterium]|nr:NAD(P)/FAD-dependent oxidoreductase [Caulobacterales bacterium]